MYMDKQENSGGRFSLGMMHEDSHGSPEGQRHRKTTSRVSQPNTLVTESTEFPSAAHVVITEQTDEDIDNLRSSLRVSVKENVLTSVQSNSYEYGLPQTAEEEAVPSMS